MASLPVIPIEGALAFVSVSPNHPLVIPNIPLFIFHPFIDITKFSFIHQHIQPSPSSICPVQNPSFIQTSIIQKIYFFKHFSFIHPSIHSSINPLIYLSCHQTICPFIQTSIHLFMHCSKHPSSVHPSLYSFMQTSIYLSNRTSSIYYFI